MHRRPGDHPEPGIVGKLDRIDFAPGIAFIKKQNLARRRERLEQTVSLVGRTVSPNNFLWLEVDPIGWTGVGVT